MGDKKREQSITPEVAPGQDIISGLIASLTDRGLQRFGGPFVAEVGEGEQNFLAGIQGLGIPGFLGEGFASLQNIASGGLADAAAPGLERLLGIGSASLNEQAALSGVLSSSGAAQNQADFTANAVAQLQQTLAPLQLGAAQTLASPQTAGIGGTAFSLERLVEDLGIQRELQNFQQEQSLIPGLLSGAGAAAAGTSFFQPTTGPGKSESLLTAAAPILGQLLQGRIQSNRQGGTAQGPTQAGAPGSGPNTFGAQAGGQAIPQDTSKFGGSDK